jgi:chromate transport protein ChrA
MEAVLIILVAALLAEAVWETGKMVWQQGKISVDRIGALLVGILFAVGAGLDLCTVLGICFVYPIIGQLLTGILISRGANFVHDLLKRAQQLSA